MKNQNIQDLQSVAELKRQIGKKLFAVALNGCWGSKSHLKDIVKGVKGRRKNIGGSKSIAAAVDAVIHTRDVLDNLREEKRKRKAVPFRRVMPIHRKINDPLHDRIASMISVRVRDALSDYRFETTPAIDRGAPGVVQTEDLDWNYYSKSCKYPKKRVETTITVSDTWSRDVYHNDIDLVDGLATLSAERVDTAEHAVYKAVWLHQGRGYALDVVSGFIAVNGHLAYHSTRSTEHAENGLNLKIAAQQINETGIAAKTTLERVTRDVKNNPDAQVTWSLALSAACKPGISSWLNKVGIDPDVESVPVSRVFEGYCQAPAAEALTIIRLAIRQHRAVAA